MNIKYPVALLLTFCVVFRSTAQVGIGTISPNSKAVLELKSPGNDQGFLPPRLTTLERTSISGLSTAEKGLLVFDTNDNKFYYWSGSAWIVIEDSVGSGTVTNISTGSGLTGGPITVSGTIDLADNGVTTVKILNGAVTDAKIAAGVTVSKLSPGTNGQVLTTVTGTTAWSTLPDASATNEIQNLTLGSKSGTVQPVNISGGTGVSIDVADNDNSITNEIQNLSLGAKSGTVQPVNISGGTGISIDVADNDNSTANEIQDLSLTGNTLSLTSDVTTVNLAPFMDNTDSQALTFTTPNLSISGGNSVNLSSLNTDAQNLSFTSPNLTITGGNSVNLSTINTDNQNLSLGAKTGTSQAIGISGGTGISIDVADNDNSITNEIQNLSLGAKSGTVQPVNISGGAGVSIDVADNDNNATNEIQNLSVVVGGASPTLRTINISGGGTSAVLDVADGDNNATNEIQSLSIAGNQLSISSGNTVTIPTSSLSGSGTNTQVAFWGGPSSLTGSSNLIWDDKLPGLGIGVTPKATFHTGGSLAAVVTIAKPGAYPVDVKDYIILAPNGTTDIGLPDAVDLLGRILIIRSTDAKGVRIVSASGKDTIDKLGSLTIADADNGSVYCVTLIAVQAGSWLTIDRSIK